MPIHLSQIILNILAHWLLWTHIGSSELECQFITFTASKMPHHVQFRHFYWPLHEQTASCYYYAWSGKLMHESSYFHVGQAIKPFFLCRFNFVITECIRSRISLWKCHLKFDAPEVSSWSLWSIMWKLSYLLIRSTKLVIRFMYDVIIIWNTYFMPAFYCLDIYISIQTVGSSYYVIY